jgi:hypothetical protein
LAPHPARPRKAFDPIGEPDARWSCMWHGRCTDRAPGLDRTASGAPSLLPLDDGPATKSDRRPTPLRRRCGTVTFPSLRAC